MKELSDEQKADHLAWEKWRETGDEEVFARMQRVVDRRLDAWKHCGVPRADLEVEARRWVEKALHAFDPTTEKGIKTLATCVDVHLRALNRFVLKNAPATALMLESECGKRVGYSDIERRMGQLDLDDDEEAVSWQIAAGAWRHETHRRGARIYDEESTAAEEVDPAQARRATSS